MPKKIHTMRWKCDQHGCWKDKNQLTFEIFTDCFPRSINFSDLDGIVELNSKFLILEWKHTEGLPTGQRLMLERMTRLGDFTAFVVMGDAESMQPTSMQEWHNGQGYQVYKCDQALLIRRVTDWANYAMGERAA